MFTVYGTERWKLDKVSSLVMPCNLRGVKFERYVVEKYFADSYKQYSNYVPTTNVYFRIEGAQVKRLKGAACLGQYPQERRADGNLRACVLVEGFT